MGLVVGFFEAVSGDVGIDLGGDQMRVAQQFLDAAQVGARIQKVRGVTVSQLVRREARIETGDGEVFF